MRSLLLGVFCFFGVPATGQIIAPEAVEAVEKAGDRDWGAAYAIAAGQDDVTRDVVTWLRLRSGSGDFGTYQSFVMRRPDWPGLDRIRARGERAIPKGLEPADVLRWFGDREPSTGIGAVRLAEALIARGEVDLGKDVVATAWTGLELTENGEEAILTAFADVVAPLHAERADALLWRWRTDAAERMLPRLSEDQQKLVEARLAYIRKSDDINEKAAAVPAALRNTPGLAYDRYNWLADTGKRRQAIAVLLDHSTSAATLGEPFRWSGWRRSLARWEMRNGDPKRAYRIAADHFLADGSSFADLEWVAGYLSLRYLNKPEQALEHFRTARAAVDSPISVSRMEYWTAQAQEALGQPADEAYRAASVHQTAFYGLLAAEKLGLSLDPALTGADDADDWQQSGLFENDLVIAALSLLEAGERGAAVTFFVELGKQLPPDDLARLGALLDTMDESFFEVVLGKSAVTQGKLVPSIYFPIHELAELDLPVDPALSLSIARRESEFNAGVGSPVGALGLMQLMPATAREVAGFLELPYSRPRLTADWRYNARLGSKYLEVLRDQFGPSPVMIAAGYNAGPSRPEIWMDERGDPRIGEMDVVDWIEHIPFRETRNYVMRVTESLPVYEARLTGIANPIRFRAMLIGEKPILRPELRPERTPAQISTSGPIARPGPTRPRPVARPDR